MNKTPLRIWEFQCKAGEAPATLPLPFDWGALVRNGTHEVYRRITIHRTAWYADYILAHTIHVEILLVQKS